MCHLRYIVIWINRTSLNSTGIRHKRVWKQSMAHNDGIFNENNWKIMIFTIVNYCAEFPCACHSLIRIVNILVDEIWFFINIKNVYTQCWTFYRLNCIYLSSFIRSIYIFSRKWLFSDKYLNDCGNPNISRVSCYFAMTSSHAHRHFARVPQERYTNETTRNGIILASKWLTSKSTNQRDRIISFTAVT